MPQHLTLQEVADRLSCDVKTVRRRVDDGAIPAIDVARPGAKRRILRVSEDALASYTQAHRTTPAPAR